MRKKGSDEGVKKVMLMDATTQPRLLPAVHCSLVAFAALALPRLNRCFLSEVRLRWMRTSDWWPLCFLWEYLAFFNLVNCLSGDRWKLPLCASLLLLLSEVSGEEKDKA